MAFLYPAWQLLLIALIATGAFVIGKGVFKSSLNLSPAEEIAILTPAGLGIIILLLFFLGLMHQLAVIQVFFSLAVLVLISLWRLRTAFSVAGTGAWLQRIRPVHCMLIVAGITILIPVLLTPATPPYQSDEIRYHLPYALHFMEQRGLDPDLALRYPFYTLNINLLYTLALLFGDDVTPHYMHLLFGLLAALNCYVLALRLANRRVAIASALLFLILPAVSRLTASAYIDLGLACFTFSALVCLSFANNTGRYAIALCAALLFGIALGAKYLALGLFPVMVVWAWFHTRDTKATAIFSAGALLIGLPWYLFNLYYTGNPVSPFAGNLFGYWPWTEADMTVQLQELAGHGEDKSLTALLSLPYNLVVNFADFSSPAIPALLMPVFPAFFFIPWIDRAVRPWFVLLLSAVLLWFFSAQVFRYLAAFLPLWCFLLIWMIDRYGRALVAKLPVKSLADGSNRERVAAGVSILVMALCVTYTYVNNDELVYPEEARFRIEQREQFLDDFFDEYGVIRFIRDSGIEGRRIFQVQTGALLSYIRNNNVVGDVFGQFGYAGYLSRYGASKEGFIEELSGQGVSLLVFRKNFLRNQPAWQEYLETNLEILYQDQYTVLFSITD